MSHFEGDLGFRGFSPLYVSCLGNLSAAPAPETETTRLWGPAGFSAPLRRCAVFAGVVIPPGCHAPPVSHTRHEPALLNIQRRLMRL